MSKPALVTDEEFRRFQGLIEKRCKVLSTAVARLYYVKNNCWEYSDTGIISITKDNERRNYYIQLFNMDNFVKTQEFDILFNSIYDIKQQQVHTCSTGKCNALLNFADQIESEKFGFEVKNVIKIRQEQKEKKRQSQINPSNDVEVAYNNFTHEANEPRFSVPKVETKPSNIKSPKKLTKNDISNPMNFQHLDHMGLNDHFFTNPDDEKIKKFLKNAGMQQLLEDKTEMEAIYDFVDKHGGMSKLENEMKQKEIERKNSPKKLTKNDISNPMNFQHLDHMGLNDHLFTNPDDENIKKFHKNAGMQQLLEDKTEMEDIYDFVDKHGGMSKVGAETQKDRSPVRLKLSENSLNVNLRNVKICQEMAIKLERNSEEIELSDVEFKEILMDGQFQLHETLLERLPTKFLSENISKEIIERAIATNRLKLIELLFSKANGDVQNQVQEDILFYHAINDNEVDFETLLIHNVVSPKSFENGENLLTNLIKSNKLKFVWKLLSSNNSHLYINLKNSKLRSPLQVAIEMNSLDIAEFLINESSQLNDEDENGITALELIFQKMNDLTDIGLKYRMKSVAKSIVNKGGDIYKITSKGYRIIDLYKNSSFVAEIETYYKNENLNRNLLESEKLICSICLDNEINCVYKCGHTFCMTCAETMYCCPVCRSKPTNPTRIFLS